MSKSQNSTPSRAKRKRMLKAASGYVGRAKNCYKVASRKVKKGLQYQYRDRKDKKRQFRSLWIARVNAFARQNGLTYSKLIDSLNKSNLDINRKILANLAFEDPAALKSLLVEVGVIVVS